MSQITVTLVPSYTLTVVTLDDQRITCHTTNEALALAFVEAMQAVVGESAAVTLEEHAEYLGGYTNMDEIVGRLGGVS